MWSQQLHLGLKCLWISISNVSPSNSNLLCIFFEVHTIYAETFFVAEAALCEALTVHFDTLRTRALACEIIWVLG